MKKYLSIVALCWLALDALAIPSIITVNKKQFGDKWAFSKEEVQLQCTGEGALFVINESTLVQYPLDERARDLMVHHKVRAQPLEKILLDDPQRPGEKISAIPFIDRARLLCR